MDSACISKRIDYFEDCVGGTEKIYFVPQNKNWFFLYSTYTTF